MRSDPTDRRPGPASADDPRDAPSPPAAPRTGRSTVRAFGLIALAATVVVLAACSGGAVQESRRSQARDAAQTPQLPARQATRTANRFFPPTPTPTPAPPPPPVLDSLVVTLGIGAGDVPSGSYASVPADAGTAFAAALLHEVRAGQAVTAIWTDGFGNQVATSSVEFAADAGEQWVALPLPLNGSLSPGEYGVYLFAGDRRLGSLAFTITGPGSGPRPLPDLPSNPQVQPAPAPPAEDDGDPERRRNRDNENGEEDFG